MACFISLEYVEKVQFLYRFSDKILAVSSGL